MSCAQFREQAMAYALGALSAEEAEAFRAHLRDSDVHEGCLEALAQARATLEAMDRSLPPVSAELWQRLEAKVAPRPTGARRLREAAAWLAFAASIVALVLTRGEVRTLRAGLHAANGQAERIAKGLELSKESAARCERELASQDAWMTLLEDAGTRVVALQPVAGVPVRAVLVYNSEAKRALLVSSSHAPDGLTMQAWVGHHEKMRSAGLMRLRGNLSIAEVDPGLLTESPDAVGVSLEPIGGSATPTQMVLLAKLT